MVKGQANASLDDLADLLGRDVLRMGEHARGDRQAVEDVFARVPGHLLDAPDLGAVGCLDAPARLDEQPRDGRRHQTVLPASIHTGPWVAASFVSESTRSTVIEPRMSASSQRSKQRPAIWGETP